MAVVAITPPHLSRTTIFAALAGIIVVAGVAWGSALALQIAGPNAGTGGDGIHRVNDAVPTSFGTVGVEFVRSVDGVSHRSLNGASHGVSGLVDGEHAQIQTAVALTNDLNKPLSFTTKQFRLLVTVKGKTTPQKPTSGDLPNTRILPRAGIQGHLSFTVPRSGAQLALEFTDPGSAKPVLIDLGDAAFGPRPEASHSHQ